MCKALRGNRKVRLGKREREEKCNCEYTKMRAGERVGAVGRIDVNLMMIYCCDLGVTPFLLLRHLLPLSSIAVSISLFFAHVTHVTSDNVTLTERAESIRARELWAGREGEKKGGTPDFLPVRDFSHCRLTRRAWKTRDWTDRRPITQYLAGNTRAHNVESWFLSPLLAYASRRSVSNFVRIISRDFF